MSGVYWLSAAILAVLVIVYLLAADRQEPSDPPGTRAARTLLFVAAFSRHGNRAPIYSYPSAQFLKDDPNWPLGPSQLTKSGELQMYRLGGKIRSLYNGFLSEQYHPGDVAAFSTHFDRCFNSVLLILARLFSPRGIQVWNSDLLWQPVPFKYTDRDHVRIIYTEDKMCPKYYKEKLDSFARLERDFGSNFTRLLAYPLHYITSDVGRTLNTSMESMWMEAYTLWDFLESTRVEGLQLPIWASHIYPQPLTPVIVEAFKAVTSDSDTMTRLLSGDLFQEMVGFMEARLRNESDSATKLYLYNGHDFTIVGLQRILGLTHACRWLVETSSVLLVELHVDPATSRPYVKVLYIDGASEDLEPVEVDIPGCESPCSFSQMLNMTRKYYNITDWKTECYS